MAKSSFDTVGQPYSHQINDLHKLALRKAQIEAFLPLGTKTDT